MKMGEAIHDPGLYGELSQPVALDEATDRVGAFLAEVRELRIKHRVPDVVTIAQINVADRGPMVVYGHNGSSANMLPMMAQAFTTERDRLVKAVDSLVPPVRKRGRK